MNFRQCMLERKTKKGYEVTTSWLPEKYTIKGRILKLQNRKTGEWSDGWRVDLVGTLTKTKEEVIKRSQDYKNQRKASDI